MIKTVLTLIGAAILAFGLVTHSPPAPAFGPGKTASGAVAGGS